MADAFIVRRGGGGGAGATLEITGVVTSPASTVTITNTALGKTYTKTLDSAGKALFKGLKSGTWNITMTDGIQVATDSINIIISYSKEMEYSLRLYYHGTESPIIGTINMLGKDVSKDGGVIHLGGNSSDGSGFCTSSHIVFNNYIAQGYTTLVLKGDFSLYTTSYQSIGVSNKLCTNALWGTDGPYWITRANKIDNSTMTLSLNSLSSDRKTKGWIAACGSVRADITEILLTKD